MSIDVTSDALIESVKRRIIIPQSQLLFDDREIARILTEEMHSDIVPVVMQVHEEYFVTNKDVDIDPNVSSYDVPSRAIGMKARDVCLLDQNGNEIMIPRLQPEMMKNQPVDVRQWVYGYYWNQTGLTFAPSAVNLQPYQLRWRIFRRPNNIVITSDAGQITAIDTNTKEVTLGNVSSDWTAATTFDVVQNESPFRAVGEDQTISNLAGFVLTFDELPDDMEVGDWVAESGYAPIAQIPFEAQKLLCQRAAVYILGALGDEHVKEAESVYEDMADKVRQILTPRTDGTPQKLVSWGGLFDYGPRVGRWFR